MRFQCGVLRSVQVGSFRCRGVGDLSAAGALIAGAVTPLEPMVKASSASTAAPASSADTALAAAMAAQRQASRVKILGDRTDNSQAFENPGGTQTYAASWSRVARGWWPSALPVLSVSGAR
jgi:hypothetical protein